MKTYIIQDREAGNKIEEFDSLQEAQNKLQEYEEQDKAEGIYEENFYEIVEKEEEQKMKVYILKGFYLTVGEEPQSYIIGVFQNREKAVEERRKIIVDEVLNYGFIIDENLKNNHKKEDIKNINLITLFWDYQENWENYEEYEIIEKEVE